MKKFLVLALSLIFVLSVFTACGSGNDNNVKDDMTTMMESASSAVDDIADDLTEGKNIGEEDNTSDEGILEEIMPGDESTTDITGTDTTDGTDQSTTGEGLGMTE